MVKTMSRHGNSQAIVIEKPILDLLRITPETPLDISTDGQNLIIRPVHDRPCEVGSEFKGLTDRLVTRYQTTLKRLAE